MRFAALRKAMIDAGGVTQKRIAMELGITENTMTLKMKGATGFTLGQMIKIQQLLGGVPLDQLFADEKPEKESDGKEDALDGS